MAEPNTTVEPMVLLCPCSPTECTLPVDLILRSPDGSKVGAHMKNLALFSDGFPSPDDVTDSHEGGSGKRSEPPIVDLEEDVDTLRYLMRFMHRAQYPRLSTLKVEEVFKLAAAAEKYLVHAAILACNVYIEGKIGDYPLESLVYGARFGYTDIVDKTARRTIAESLEEVEKATGGGDSSILLAWMRYREAFIAASDIATSQPDGYVDTSRGAYHSCHNWNGYYNGTLIELPSTTQGRLELIAKLPDPTSGNGMSFHGFGESYSEYEAHLPQYDVFVSRLGRCEGCLARRTEWRRKFATRVCEAPKFSSFMKA